ncbi:MAG TPA: GldG family protein, partial [Chthoniobacteraceae bacterium]|nr:GldG family protein [Chthoniobacteraceae bacterium]
MKKSVQSLLYSTLGLVAVFMVIVAVNYLAGRVPKRIDLTEEKAYTLSDGTRSILSRLPSPIQIRLYATRNETIPPQLRLYVQQVEDLLEEIRQASNGRVEIQKLDPEPDSEAEDSARLDGVEGQALPNGEQLYLGLSVSLLDHKEAIPFLSPERERLLEYDIARAISRVITEEKPVVGVMSPLPLAGMPNAPMMMMQMPQGQQEPWVFYSELQRDFTVREIPLTADSIPEEVKVLLVIHPRGISEATEYALDQFVLRGGKLIAYLDPSAVTDEAQGGGMPGSPSEGSNLEKLLSAWGITFDSTQTVADMEY